MIDFNVFNCNKNHVQFSWFHCTLFQIIKLYKLFFLFYSVQLIENHKILSANLSHSNRYGTKIVFSCTNTYFFFFSLYLWIIIQMIKNEIENQENIISSEKERNSAHFYFQNNNSFEFLIFHCLFY